MGTEEVVFGVVSRSFIEVLRMGRWGGGTEGGFDRNRPFRSCCPSSSIAVRGRGGGGCWGGAERRECVIAGVVEDFPSLAAIVKSSLSSLGPSVVSVIEGSVGVVLCPVRFLCRSARLLVRAGGAGLGDLGGCLSAGAAGEVGEVFVEGAGGEGGMEVPNVGSEFLFRNLAERCGFGLIGGGFALAFGGIFPFSPPPFSDAVPGDCFSTGVLSPSPRRTSLWGGNFLAGGGGRGTVGGGGMRRVVGLFTLRTLGFCRGGATGRSLTEEVLTTSLRPSTLCLVVIISLPSLSSLAMADVAAISPTTLTSCTPAVCWGVGVYVCWEGGGGGGWRRGLFRFKALPGRCFFHCLFGIRCSVLLVGVYARPLGGGVACDVGMCAGRRGGGDGRIGEVSAEGCDLGECEVGGCEECGCEVGRCGVGDCDVSWRNDI